MPPSNLLIASLNFTRAETVGAGIRQFIADRSLVIYGVENLTQTWPWDEWWTNLSQWLSRPGICPLTI